MKYYLVVQEWMAPPDHKIEWSTHSAYANLRRKLVSDLHKELNGVDFNHDKYVDYLNKYLARLNARVVDIGHDQTVFEFAHEEDLTQFVMVWS